MVLHMPHILVLSTAKSTAAAPARGGGGRRAVAAAAAAGGDGRRLVWLGLWPRSRHYPSKAGSDLVPTLDQRRIMASWAVWVLGATCGVGAGGHVRCGWLTTCWLAARVGALCPASWVRVPALKEHKMTAAEEAQ
eukprot:gene12448-biopygen22974